LLTIGECLTGPTETVGLDLAKTLLLPSFATTATRVEVTAAKSAFAVSAAEELFS
jgi:hypothetical protein